MAPLDSQRATWHPHRQHCPLQTVAGLGPLCKPSGCTATSWEGQILGRQPLMNCMIFLT